MRFILIMQLASLYYTIKHYLCMRANPYVIRANFNTAVFPWDLLLERGGDLADKILGLCHSKIFAYRVNQRPCPEAVRPPQLPSYLSTNQILEVERSRAEITGHGPHDKLTVTFSDIVTRGHGFGLDRYAAEAEEEGLPFDEDAICAAMDYKHTWTDVSKIRLVRGRAYLDDQCTRCYVELVRQGTDGEETVRIGHGFSLTVMPGYTPMHIFARRLSEELHLRHAFVDGVDEYAV